MTEKFSIQIFLMRKIVIHKCCLYKSDKVRSESEKSREKSPADIVRYAAQIDNILFVLNLYYCNQTAIYCL